MCMISNRILAKYVLTVQSYTFWVLNYLCQSIFILVNILFVEKNCLMNIKIYYESIKNLTYLLTVNTWVEKGTNIFISGKK